MPPNRVFPREGEFPETLSREGTSLYEVFRVFKGRVLFLEDNLARLANSTRETGWEITIPAAGIVARLERLVRQQGIEQGNIKYVLHATARGVEEYLYRIPHDYPGEKEYREGVKVITLRASRENAGVKYIDPGLRAMTDRLIREHDAREVILVDEQGYITEGSRSSIFLVREGKLFTAPVPLVLPGTTRKRVIESCLAAGIPVIEQRVARDSLQDVQAAFLTGTSLLVLPLRQVDETPLDAADPLLRRVMKLYFSLLD